MVSNIAPVGKRVSHSVPPVSVFSVPYWWCKSGGIGELLAFNGYLLASILCCIWLLLIRGLQATNRRNVTHLKTTTQTTSLALQQLLELEGVVDITVVPDEQVMYLKAEQD
jgi:hypothetical protein